MKYQVADKIKQSLKYEMASNAIVISFTLMAHFIAFNPTQVKSLCQI